MTSIKCICVRIYVLLTRDSQGWKCLIAGKKDGHTSVWTTLEFSLHCDPRWDKSEWSSELGRSRNEWVPSPCFSEWWLFLGKEILLCFWEEPFKSKWEATFTKFLLPLTLQSVGALDAQRPEDPCSSLRQEPSLPPWLWGRKLDRVASWISGLVLQRTQWVLVPGDLTHF